MSLRINSPLPLLNGATAWIHGEPDMDQIKGNPLLVYFWAVSCHICHQNMPKLAEWREKYVPKGLGMIAVHCPRMKTDTDINKVKAAVEVYGIQESCAVDNRHKIKQAFDNELWPAYFLFDKDGKLRLRAAGNHGIAMLTPLMKKIFG